MRHSGLGAEKRRGATGPLPQKGDRNERDHRVPSPKGGAGREDKEMASRKTYRVLVTETYQKVALVDAGSEEEARQRVEDAWKSMEFKLDVEDFQGSEFYVTGDATALGEEKGFWVEPKGGEAYAEEACGKKACDGKVEADG